MPGSAVEDRSALEGVSTLPAGLPKLTLGWGVLHEAAKLLRQPNGPKAGQPWSPTDSQARFMAWWYAVDEDGRWLFHHGVRRLVKGSGKSPHAAVMALMELVGPVRLDFDTFDPAAGICLGKPTAMPLVQIAATAESATANTMRMVRAMASKGSRIVRDYSVDVGKTVFYTPDGGQLEVITSSASAAEGAEVTFCVLDETEHWTAATGGPTLAATIDRNLAKSSSRAIETANAWQPGIGSVAETTFDAWLAQEEGRTRGESRILYDARIAAADTDLADDESLTRALEFVYDDCFWVDLRTIRERIWDPRTRPDVSRRFYLNQPTASEDAWVAPMEWAACAKPERVVEDDEEIVLFFDGSKSRDATALIGCCVSDGHIFTVGMWEPDTAHDSMETVDAADVDRVVRLAFDRWNVQAFFADVQEWQGQVLTDWPGRYGDDLLIWAVPHGKPPQPIAWDMRTFKDQFAKAAEAAYAEILGRQLTHDGDSKLARHVGNARRRPYKEWVSVGKESASSPKKIDAAVCMIGARMVRRLVLASPEWQKRDEGGGGSRVWGF